MKPASRRPLNFLKSTLVLLGIGVLFSCRNEIQEIEAATSGMVLPNQTSFDAEYYYSEGGELRNKLASHQLDRFLGDSARVEVSGGFLLSIYDSIGEPEAFITGQEGVMLEIERKMIARHDVQVYNTEGDTLKTEELIWLQDSSRIFTEKFVTIISSQGTFTGEGFESDDSFSKYTIHKPTGVIPVPEEETEHDSEVPEDR